MNQDKFLINELSYILYILQYEDIELYKQDLIERIIVLLFRFNYEKSNI